jgi:hypothetical protein
MDKTDRLLLDCLCLRHDSDRDGLKALSLREWDEIIGRSVGCLVTPQLYLQLVRSGSKAVVPDAVWGKIQQQYFRNLAAAVRRNHALSECLGALNADGIPVVALKGVHLGELIYRNIGARILSDADLLVRKADLQRAQRCLLALGGYPFDGSLGIDLHWYLDTDYPIDMEGLWQRTKRAEIAGQTVQVLSTEDLLLHLCLHLASHHQFHRIGIRTFCDIREIISRHGSETDWNRLAETAVQWRMERAMGLTLALARFLLKAEIPGGVIATAFPGKGGEAMAARALSHIFSDTSGTRALSPFFWRIWTAGTLAGKLRNFQKVLMPPAEFISQKYPADFGSFRNFLFYFVRLKEHVLYYLDATWKMVTGEKRMRAVFEMERGNLEMKRWVRGKG